MPTVSAERVWEQTELVVIAESLDKTRRQASLNRCTPSAFAVGMLRDVSIKTMHTRAHDRPSHELGVLSATALAAVVAALHACTGVAVHAVQHVTPESLRPPE